MISDTVKLALGLVYSGAQMGESFIHNCDVLIWPVADNQTVYVMDCDYDGKPLGSGMLKVLTFWKIGLKFAKDADCTEEFLLTEDGRRSVLKQILL